MAVSGTVRARSRPRFDPRAAAKRMRRLIVAAAAVVLAWLLLKFGTEWVPAGMDTMPDAPPGSWCIVDRWSSGLRVGSDVFVATPSGRVLSRVSALDNETVTVTHANAASVWPDSRQFGAVPRQRVESTVMVVFAPGSGAPGHGR